MKIDTDSLEYIELYKHHFTSGRRRSLDDYVALGEHVDDDE